MITYYHKKPKILFAGINPHPGSDARGVPFSNNKLFWYLLSRAGLIAETEQELRQDALLQEMYHTRFNQVYGLGFLNLIDRPTKDITLLVRGEEQAGRERMEKVIKKEKPNVVCFVGKVVYEKWSGIKKFDFGWQEDIFASKAFVMHFPLRGAASVRIEELEHIARTAGIKLYTPKTI